jgi:sugar phosphate isomerase/epimerase
MRDFSNDHSALALNTATLGHNIDGHGAGWTPEQVIDACAELGYGGVVFWRREIGKRATAIGDHARKANLKVVGLCRTPFLVGPLAPKPRQAMLDDFEASIDMAAGLGAEVLTIVVGGVEPGTRGLGESLKRVGETVARMAPLSAERGVKLALEPLHPVYGGDRSCLVSMRDAVDLCETIGHPAVGIAVDVYHVWWDTSLDRELKRAGKDRILGYHLCDWLAETRDVLLDRGMMGDGVADLKAIRSAVESAGYDGLCEVEIFSANDWWKRPPREVLATCIERFRAFC